MGKMLGYILLTHGPKPKGPLIWHPAARQQMWNLRAFELETGHQFKPLSHDYARSYECLEQLPKLEALLNASQEQEAAFIIDDIGRLFRKVPCSRRSHFLDELMAAGGRIYGIRQQTLLKDATPAWRLVLLAGGQSSLYIAGKPVRRFRSEEALRNQTFCATLASRVARRRAALERARELEATRDELAARGERPTLAAIAEAANEKGLRNSRGNPWTVSTVGQALKRLEDDRQAQEKAKARKMRRRAATASAPPETTRDPETPATADTAAGDSAGSDVHREDDVG